MAEHIDYLIIGGGPAGTMAAEAIRQRDQGGRIIIVTREPYRLYSRISLPYYVKGTKTREQLFLRQEAQYTDARIDCWMNTEVAKLDLAGKIATTADGKSIQYSKLLISSGGTPFSWGVPGGDRKGVQQLNTLDQAQVIVDLLPTTNDMVIVGGGFISLEFCGIAGHHGKRATVLVLEPYYWANLLDEVSGNLIKKYLTENGIIVRTGEEVAEVLGDDRVTGVKTKKGETIPAEMVGVGIGVKRNLDFLQGTSVTVEKGVVTNEFLEASVPDVWAAGDVAEFQDIVIAKRHMLGNWSNATDQGRRAGLNMAGEKAALESVSAYSITTFDMNVTFLGDPKPEMAETIERGDRETNFGRIFVVQGKVVGATLINRVADKMPLMNLIRRKTPIDAKFRATLSDHRTPLTVS